MIVAGIDPSLSNFGLVKGYLDINLGTFENPELKLIKTQSDKKNKKQVRVNSDDLRRAQDLHKGTIAFLQGVDMVFIELPVGSQTARAMASYGICIGIAAAIPCPIIQVTPTEVKLAAVGTKTATKAEMIQWATTEYPEAAWLTKTIKGQQSLVDANEHLADAFGAIHAGVNTDTFQQLISFQKRIHT